jgi:hypothetical protein
MPAKRHPHWHAVYTAPGKSVTGISCPKVRLCVAIDSAGDVITSSRPAGKGTWVAAHVDSSPNYNDGSSALTGISCPSLRPCVAVDYDGNAVTSTSPTGGAAAWSVHLIDNGLDYECFHYGGSGPACVPGLVAVSCASVTQCTALDWAAGILSSSDPTGAASWGGGQQPASESFDSLACPSARFCLLSMLYSGEVFRFSGGVLRAQANIDRSGELIGVWCQSARMCLAAGAEGFNIVTHSIFESVDPTAAHPTWKRTYRPRHGVTAVACPSAKLCLATEDNGGVLVGTT